MRAYPQVTADLITFIGEIFNRKLHFLCNVNTHNGKEISSKLIEQKTSHLLKYKIKD